MSNYKEIDEFWLNLARTFDDCDDSTARNCNDKTTKKIKKESEKLQEYFNEHPGCTTGPAMYPNSDDESIDSSAQSSASCGQVH